MSAPPRLTASQRRQGSLAPLDDVGFVNCGRAVGSRPVIVIDESKY